MKIRVGAVTKGLAMVMAIGVFATVTPGAGAAPADAEHLKFPDGTIEVNLERTVSANGAKRFVFYAKQGQEVSLTVTPKVKGAGLSLDLDNKVLPLGKTYVWTVPIVGTYLIQILNSDDVNQDFTLDLGADYPQKKPDPADVERIEFPSGSIEVNLIKTVPANGAKRFVFNGKEGQEIALTITPKVKNTTLSIDLNGKTVTPGKLYSSPITKAGDFKIQVLNHDNVDREFYLDLGVAAAPKTAAPERIQFTHEIIEVNLEKTAPANGGKRFVFTGKKGQLFNLTVTPKVNGAKVTIKVGNTTVTPGKTYRFRASTSGNFYIQVTNSDAINREFYLDLGVTGP